MDPRAVPSLDFTRLCSAYRSGDLTPVELVEALYTRLESRGDDGIWISKVPRHAAFQRAAQLAAMSRSEAAQLPLYGLPFSVKDCIDVAGMTTTAACPAYGYVAAHTNLAVQRALDAGAILIGKTNMDQFATGVVGVRTPYGIARNPFDAAYIPGGSSSGAAVAVSSGLCAFSFGTDTGGSGRVPASYNNVVGLKPSLGLLSRVDMVNASRSFDTVSVFALTADDALKVLETCQACDPRDPYGRVLPAGASSTISPGAAFTVVVPRGDQREFFSNTEAAVLYEAGLGTLAAMGGRVQEIDFRPFAEASRMMFDGPWLAERYSAVGAFIAAHAGQVDPAVRQVILGSARYTAAEAFEAIHRLSELRRLIQGVFEAAEVLAVPTVGTVYRIDEVLADPIATNASNGYYLNYANMADLAAVAVPNGFLASGVPMGMTLLAPAFSDAMLARLAGEFHARRSLTLGATGSSLPGSEKRQFCA